MTGADFIHMATISWTRHMGNAHPIRLANANQMMRLGLYQSVSNNITGEARGKSMLSALD